jgi:hypothetical protein
MLVSDTIYLDALLLLLGDNSERSRSLVKDFIELVDRNTGRGETITPNGDLIEVYKRLIKSVITENISQDNGSTSKILLLRVKSDEVIKEYPVVRDILTDVLQAKEPISDVQLDGYLRNIRNAVVLAEIDLASRKFFGQVMKTGEIKDPELQEAEIFKLIESLDTTKKTIERRQDTTEAKASESFVSLSDAESINRSLDIYMDRSVRGVIRTGLQGMNKALGSRGGMGLGESWIFAAPSHHYKSGILNKIMLWTVEYNPQLADLVEPGKKALIYFISLENEVHQNLMSVFRTLYTRQERQLPDLSIWTADKITEWLKAYFGKFNIEIIIDRYTPHEFTFRKFERRFNYFMEHGFQVLMVDLDYLSEARGVDPGDTMSALGRMQTIDENYIRFVHHAKQMGYLFVTGHQLIKAAEDLASKGVNPVKKFTAFLMAESSNPYRNVDGLFFIYLETNFNMEKFLTMVNRKNRGSEDTLERDKFFAYKFDPVLGIEDDINDAPRYVTDINAYSGQDNVAAPGASGIVEAAMF